MKVMSLTGPGQIEVVHRQTPDIQRSEDVLIRMKSIGICGSDIHYFKDGRIGDQIIQYPFSLGHEGAGVVERVGSQVHNLKPGERVAVEPAMPCYKCDQCLTGRYNTCRNLRFLGCPGQAAGCLSEYLVIPASSCHPVPDSMSFDQAALTEPLAIGVYSVKQGLESGMKIGILGSGPIGISVMLASKAYGAGKIYMTDLVNQRLALAGRMGADWTGNPADTDITEGILAMEPDHLDLVYECCGKQEAVNQGVKLLKPGGTLFIIGIPRFSTWHFDVNDLRRKEISIINIRRSNKVLDETIELVAAGRIRPDPMQTHNFTLDQVGQAFDLLSDYKDGIMKAMIHI
ncbi:MAG: alcohol dehydrogenase catalytic domain-containing protein [Bacteroidales bacterium]|nr:alcohol dehydrogenase catalytic domain-containing protein [Bacteroidales bacterium]